MMMDGDDDGCMMEASTVASTWQWWTMVVDKQIGR